MARKPIEITEQDIADILLLNTQNTMSAHRIARQLCIPYTKVLAVIKCNGGVLRQGGKPSDDGTTIKEQAKALWDNGLHNVDLIAQRLGTSHKNILWYLNNCYNIKTRPEELPIDYEAEKIAKRQIGGESTWGEIANLAKKFEVSRQFAHQRVEFAKEKLKNV